MKLLSKALIAFFILCINYSAFAHEMWLETNPQGKEGQVQEVKVFFGEFSWGNPTETAKWFSDIASCKIVVTAPDGSKQTLEKQQEAKYYKASFTPNQKGIYKIDMVHVVKDVYKEMKLTYVSAAVVNVGGIKSGKTIVGENHFQLQLDNQSFVKTAPSSFTVLEAGKLYGDQSIEVSNTDSVTNNLKTDKNATFSFPKSYKGGQLINIPYPQKLEATQQHNGKDYNVDYTVFTFYSKP